MSIDDIVSRLGRKELSELEKISHDQGKSKEEILSNMARSFGCRIVSRHRKSTVRKG